MKTDFQTFAEDTHRCAMALLHNAAYILKELPAIDLPDPLRSEVIRLCEVWVGIKHDLLGALGDLAETLRKTPTEAEAIDRHCGTIQSILGEIFEPTDATVRAMMNASRQNPDYSLASLLIVESAGNVLGSIPAALSS